MATRIGAMPLWSHLTLTLPPYAFVGLPVGHVEPLRFCRSPALARGRDGLRIPAVEEEHQALVGTGIRRNRRAVDQEAHARAVRVVLPNRQHDRLLGRGRLPVGSMRQ